MNCRRMGQKIGKNHLCEAECSPENVCIGCKKIFKNARCYVVHIANGVCPKFERCKSGVIWNKKVNTKGDRKGHVCDDRFCRKCLTYHSTKGGCFIEKELFGAKPEKHQKLTNDQENIDDEMIESEIDEQLVLD